MRKTALAAGGFALVLGLTACGGGETEGKAEPFGSVQELVQAAMTGTQENQTANFTLSMDAAGEKVEAEGAGRFETENPALMMTGQMEGEAVELRFIGDEMYIKGGGGFGDMPEMQGKEWLKIGGDASDPMSRMLGPMFQKMGQQMDVSKSLEKVREAGTITNSERTELDGQAATHYWVDLDLAKVMEIQMKEIKDQLPPGMEGELDNLDQQFDAEKKAELEKMGPMPLELWLNERQLPLKIVMDVTAMAKAQGQPDQGGSMVVRYTDWGSPVDISPPPADKVGTIEMPR
ncbi:hypothetical protein [Amycolatopsis cihanbeyliensis]|uniref:Lipoprotein n=1 Tax=Amycolatopsis cihanbeyliensis TaxID=1128664 RepID=A0A542DHH4_AMYCI|nr:hypothetical protein [Amycolatopsis cihanbeyliensis]TQJ02538.1 hypothetical protein FB471_2270 [Amycolatopsis cihanbeyliensis]